VHNGRIKSPILSGLARLTECWAGLSPERQEQILRMVGTPAPGATAAAVERLESSIQGASRTAADTRRCPTSPSDGPTPPMTADLRHGRVLRGRGDEGNERKGHDRTEAV
jgi:hypothetical protein